MSNPTSRVSAGVPTGGQFAVSAKTEAGLSLSDLAREAQANADRLTQEAEAQRALSYRIEAYSLMKDYPDDYTVDTTIWPEDVNDDGSFDVSFGRVYDDEGHEVEDFEGNPGAIPAGWSDGTTDRTAFDAWRTDSTDVHSLISVKAAKSWFADNTANRAVEQEKKTHYTERTPVEHARGAINNIEADLISGPPEVTGRGSRIGRTDVGITYYGLKDEDGYTKPRGTNGDITLIGNKEVRTFPFGTPSDPDNHETFESARDAAAEVLAEWNG